MGSLVRPQYLKGEVMGMVKCFLCNQEYPYCTCETEDRKEAFIFTYVLNRAYTSLNLNGKGAVRQAFETWDLIQKKLKE